MTDFATSNKLNKSVLLLINLLFIGPHLLSNMSGTVSLPLAIGAYLFAIWRIVVKSPEARPACGHVAQVFFLDCCLAFIAQFESLQIAYDGDVFGESLAYLLQQVTTNSNLLVLDVVSVVLFLFSGKLESRSWMKSAAGGLLGLAFLMPAWSDCNLLDLAYVNHGRAVLALYCIGVLLWIVMSEVSYAVTDPELRVQNRWFGRTMLVALVIMLCCEYSFCVYAAEGAAQWMLEFPTQTLTWVKSIALALILVAAGLPPYLKAPGKLPDSDPDTWFFWMAAASVIVFRVLLSSYFAWSWIVMVAYVGYGVYLFINDVTLRSYRGLGWARYCGVGVAVIFLSVLMHHGLILPALTSIIVCAILYKERNKHFLTETRWEAVIGALGCMVLAWQISRRLSLGNVCILVAIVAMSLATIRQMYRRHPSNQEPDVRLGLAVVACTVILLLLASRTVVSVRTEVVGNKATVEAHAKSGRSVSSMTYCWRDAFGRIVERGEERDGKRWTDTVRSEVLVVEALDSEGSASTYVYYFPPWLHAFDTDDGK